MKLYVSRLSRQPWLIRNRHWCSATTMPLNDLLNRAAHGIHVLFPESNPVTQEELIDTFTDNDGDERRQPALLKLALNFLIHAKEHTTKDRSIVADKIDRIMLSKNLEGKILCAYCDSWVATQYQSISLDVIPNMVIEAYCNKGDFDKATSYVDQVIPKGKQYLTSTWVCFVTAYIRKNDMGKAVEIMIKCVVAEDKRGCRLNKDTLGACVKYLKENGDLQMA
ncbi:pentatricopeptide repeat-containing protein [Tanacetum coccineum]